MGHDIDIGALRTRAHAQVFFSIFAANHPCLDEGLAVNIAVVRVVDAAAIEVTC